MYVITHFPKAWTTHSVESHLIRVGMSVLVMLGVMLVNFLMSARSAGLAPA